MKGEAASVLSGAGLMGSPIQSQLWGSKQQGENLAQPAPASADEGGTWGATASKGPPAAAAAERSPAPRSPAARPPAPKGAVTPCWR